MEENMEQYPQESPKPKKRASVRIPRWLYNTVLAFFIIAFTVSLILLARYAVQSWRNGSDYDDLSDRRQQILATLTTAPETSVPPTTQDATAPATLPAETEPTEPQILPEYLEFYLENPDMVGWITVPGTKIDYPVMQTPSSKDYYLNHNFDKAWSSWGAIYAREACDINAPSDNVVLYGHHMADGSMFAQLDKFKKKSFWETHQTFTFDTLYERHTYQIIAVFKTSANLGQGFRYHQFNDAASEEDFNEFIETVKSLAFYETGVTAEYGDKLVTLSTCEYTLNNGRFVVVAKRIS